MPHSLEPLRWQWVFGKVKSGGWEADAQTMADLHRQVAELTARFCARATPTPQLSLAERFRGGHGIHLSNNT